MKLLKTDWIHHDGKPIFSVDVHPDGTKLATGGHGNDSGRVVIWNMKPVLTEAAARDPGCARILCQLDQHAACVNCVRWSGNGVLLASGGDDKVVMVWKRGKGPSAVFGNGGITKVAESWRCVVTLRGHEGDVLDLSWSVQDRWLATCSVDNTIMVWDMAGLLDGAGGGGGGAAAPRAAWLRGHTGLVKGVAWDPVGKFIASQSDDRTVRIWRTADWTCQSTISEPFEECGGTTHVLRLSWSPDGLYLVSAHAMNGGGPTAQIIEREGFKCDKDFVGHRKAVTCVRFHNAILRRPAPKTTNKFQQYCCLAIGSRDRSLSVWMTSLQRPLVVIHDLFRDSILDLSWSTEHNILLASSNDGTVACLQFSPDELGRPLSAANKNALYQRMYGQSVEQVDLNATQDNEVILEYAELLHAVPGSAAITTNGVDSTVVAGQTAAPAAAAATVTASRPDGAEDAAAIARLVFSEAAEGRPLTPVKPAIIKQFETRAKDGRRRITPAFIPLDQETLEYTSTPEIISSSRTNSVAVEVVQPPPEKVPKLSEPVKPSIPSIKMDTNNLDSRLSKSIPSKTQTISTAPTPSTAITATINTNSTAPSRSASIVQQPADRQLIFTSGKATPFRGTLSKSSGTYRVHISNDHTPTALGALSKVYAVSTAAGGQRTAAPLWEIFVGSPVVNFAVTVRYAIVCSVDGTVRVLDTQTGVQTLPLVKLPSPAVQCCFSPNSDLAGIITETGVVRVWRLRPLPARIHINTVCTDVLSGGYVSNLHVTDGGVVFVVLANGCSFSYCPRLESWLVVNSRDPIIRTGAAHQPPNANKNMREYPLNTVQTIANSFPAPGRSLLTNNSNSADSSNWQLHARLAFIEHQLRLCESVGTAVELQHWYGVLGGHLAEHGPERRIRLLLDELMGVPPSLCAASAVGAAGQHNGITAEHATSADGGKYLGLVRHRLLQRVLDMLQTAPRWQRVYMEYSEQLIERKQQATDSVAAPAKTETMDVTEQT